METVGTVITFRYVLHIDFSRPAGLVPSPVPSPARCRAGVNETMMKGTHAPASGLALNVLRVSSFWCLARPCDDRPVGVPRTFLMMGKKRVDS
jgi:hypothetical protein